MARRWVVEFNDPVVSRHPGLWEELFDVCIIHSAVGMLARANDTRSIVIEHIEARIQHPVYPPAALAYVYFDYKDRARQTPEVILAELIKQLAFRRTDSQSDASLSPRIEEMYDKMHPVGKRPAMRDLRELFTSLAAEFREVYLIFDALDECNEDERGVLLPSIMRLSRDQKGDVRFKIFITGRPHMQHAFADEAPLQLAIVPEKEDMKLAINEKIEAAKKKHKISAQLELDIVATVLGKADGMFLLAILHTESILRRKTPNEKRRALGLIPPDLNSTYARAMATIEAQPDEDGILALQALRWIVNAERPLHVTELQIALAIGEGEPKSELDEDDFIEVHDIIEQCASLVIVDEQTETVRLVHYTVQEYLAGVSSIRDGAHTMIAKACLNYLSLDDFRTGPCNSQQSLNSVLERHSFLDYACRHWGNHCRTSFETEGEDGDVITKALAVLKDSARLHLIFQVYFAPENTNDYGFNWSPSKLTPLHASGVFGLCGTIRAVLAEGQFGVDFRDSFGYTPLSRAASGGHEATVRLLLEEGANIEAKDQSGGTAIFHAASRGDDAIVRILLEKGANIEAKGLYRGTAICISARGGHEATVQLLLDKGADIEAKDRSGGTAISHAASCGNKAIVRLLIQKGANIEAKDHHGRTAIFWAAADGHEETVRLLLEKGAEIEAKDNNGGTAICCAASRGHEATVRILLEKGANIQAKDHYGRTAISFAAAGFHLSTARLLREKATGSGVNTAIQRAAAAGRDSSPLGYRAL